MKTAKKRRPFVYGLMDPRDYRIRYVGLTHDKPSLRLSKHMTAARNENRWLPVQFWIHELIEAGLKPSMLWLGRWQPEDRDPYEIEAEMIARFRSTGHLLNVTEGGRAYGLGPKRAEHAAKIGAALRGKKKPPRTDEWRAAHSAKMTGRTHSEETKGKMAATWAKRRVLIAQHCTQCGEDFEVIPSRVNRFKTCMTCSGRKSEY